MGIVLDILKFGVFNGFLIGLFFMVNRKGNVAANLYYGLLVLSLSAIVLENVLIMSREILSFPHLFSVGSIMLMLVPPLNYLLHIALLDLTRKGGAWKIVVHFIPFIIFLIVLAPLFVQSADIKAQIISEVYYEGLKIETQYIFFSAINIIQFLAYNLFIFFKLKSKYKRPIKRALQVRLSWANFLMLVMNLLVLMYLMTYISFVLTSKYQTLFMIIFMMLILVAIYMTGYQLIRNPFFFSKSEAIYDRSTLKKEVSIELKSRFDHLIRDDQPYLNPRLKLGELADMLDVNQHQLSQFLNQKMKITFNQLLNDFRVEHAKKLLQDKTKEDETILATALKSGFSNQANFIRVFKEITGSTPSQFRSEMAKSE